MVGAKLGDAKGETILGGGQPLSQVSSFGVGVGSQRGPLSPFSQRLTNRTAGGSTGGGVGGVGSPAPPGRLRTVPR